MIDLARRARCLPVYVRIALEGPWGYWLISRKLSEISEPPNGSIPACSLFLLSIENSEYAEGRNFDLSLTLSILSFHPKVRLTSTSQQKKKRQMEINMNMNISARIQKYKYENEYPYIEIHIRQETRDVEK